MSIFHKENTRQYFLLSFKRVGKAIDAFSDLLERGSPTEQHETGKHILRSEAPA